MRIFSKLFKKKPDKKYLTKEEIEQRYKEFKLKHEKSCKLFGEALERYNETSCQCSYPRFQQLIGIDCTKIGGSFKCLDTDLLISTAKPYFNITPSERKDENSNETWICKKCGSIYEYGWSDISIHIERQKLELIKLKTQSIGKIPNEPTPIYLGLMGHSYPPKYLMKPTEFEEFERYVLEQ